MRGPAQSLSFKAISRSHRIVFNVSPASEWPIAFRWLKTFAQPGDRGAGDIIERKIGPIGGDAFKKWWKLLFGKDCGCGARQEVLNARWPL